MIWSIATIEKLTVISSITGRSPAMAAPMPMPTKPASEIGVSTTRRSPNSRSRPRVTLNAPSYCPTSSPMMKTSGSRSISSRIAWVSASR